MVPTHFSSYKINYQVFWSQWQIVHFNNAMAVYEQFYARRGGRLKSKVCIFQPWYRLFSALFSICLHSTAMYHIIMCSLVYHTFYQKFSIIVEFLVDFVHNIRTTTATTWRVTACQRLSLQYFGVNVARLNVFIQILSVLFFC